MTMSQFRLRLTSPDGVRMNYLSPISWWLNWTGSMVLDALWESAGWKTHRRSMLDGLDEVPTAKRGLCLDRINEYRRSHTSVKFVVACRQAEYAELSADVDAHSAAVVQKLKGPMPRPTSLNTMLSGDCGWL